MKILLYVSKLPYSKPAILFTRLLASFTGASVTLLSMVSTNKRRAAAELILVRVRELIPKVKINKKIRLGSAVSGIMAEVSSGDYDLVVLSARWIIPLRDRFGGTVGRVIAKQAPIPVLIVKEEQPELKRMLICTSGLDVAEPVIEMGAQIALAAGAQVTLLYVAAPIPSMYTGLGEIEETLPELLRSDTPIAAHLRHAAEILARYQLDAEMALRHGVVHNEILREAQMGSYDMIVLGASEAPASLSGWLLGDVTQKVVNQARGPVLVVR